MIAKQYYIPPWAPFHTIMNNLVVVSLKYEAFNRDFNKAFDFPVFSNGEIFSLDVGVQYLTFKISYVRFPD